MTRPQTLSGDDDMVAVYGDTGRAPLRADAGHVAGRARGRRSVDDTVAQTVVQAEGPASLMVVPEGENSRIEFLNDEIEGRKAAGYGTPMADPIALAAMDGQEALTIGDRKRRNRLRRPFATFQTLQHRTFAMAPETGPVIPILPSHMSDEERARRRAMAGSLIVGVAERTRCRRMAGL